LKIGYVNYAILGQKISISKDREKVKARARGLWCYRAVRGVGYGLTE